MSKNQKIYLLSLQKLLRVCVHGVCVFTAVCVHFGWVKCRAQIPSMGHHTWSYVTSEITKRFVPLWTGKIDKGEKLIKKWGTSSSERERVRVFWCERSGGDPYLSRGSPDIETRCSCAVMSLNVCALKEVTRDIFRNSKRHPSIRQLQIKHLM